MPETKGLCSAKWSGPIGHFLPRVNKNIAVLQTCIQTGLPDGIFSNQKSKFLAGIAMEDGGIFYGHLVYFTYGHLVGIFPFLYVVPRQFWPSCIQTVLLAQIALTHHEHSFLCSNSCTIFSDLIVYFVQCTAYILPNFWSHYIWHKQLFHFKYTCTFSTSTSNSYICKRLHVQNNG
jgi:hypothetical protein